MKRRALLLSVLLLALGACNNVPDSSSSVDYDDVSSGALDNSNDVSNQTSRDEVSDSITSETPSTSLDSSFDSADDSSSSSNSASSSGTSSESDSSNSSDSSTPDTPLPDFGNFEGLETIHLSKGTYFNVLDGVKAYSEDGDDISNGIFVKGYVDYGKVGTYTLTYAVKDENGIQEQTRTIIVENKTRETTPFQKTYNNRTITDGLGSYRSGNSNDLESNPPSPSYLDDSLRDKPVKTSSWWTSLLIDNYAGGNSFFLNPLRSSFQDDGVEISHFGEGFTQYWTDSNNALSVAQFTIPDKDIYLKTSTLSSSYITKVIDYSDNSVKVTMRNSDSGDDEMVVTMVQGSPYLFAEMKEHQGFFNLRIPGVTEAYEFYDLNGNVIDSSYTGEAVIVKIPKTHVGYSCEVPTTPNNTIVKDPIYRDKYYLINAPKNTSFTFSQDKHASPIFRDKISFTLGNGNYISVCALENMSEANFYHQYAYSFINKAITDYEVNHDDSVVTTKYYEQYQNVDDSDNSPLLAIMPHQYKYMNSTFENYTYKTIRGTLKTLNTSYFETRQSFYGMLPTYALPTSSSFSSSDAKDYLDSLDSNTNSTFGDNDNERVGPYWDAKTFYPLAQGVIYANQLDLPTYQTKLLTKLEDLLSDWFTYSGSDDNKYLYYDEVYGSTYYSNNEFSTRTELSDHHFTHGYLVYAFAVASMYDQVFFANYKGVAKMLLNDYMNYDRNSDKFPYLRTFDTWAGHSWAHGFGSFAEGNNQESSGEALNSWVAGYLLGLSLEDQKFADAAIYGFTTELNSIKQYVFDYDQVVFSEQYSSVVNISSMIWGGKNTYATWFGLNPNFVYGIHYLPIGQYVSSYAIGSKDKSSLNRIYQGYLQKKVGFTDTWFANMWSVKALIDSTSAFNKFDKNKILNDDYPNDLIGAYWNICASLSFGDRSDEVIVTNSNKVASDVHVKNGVYYVELWNPTNTPKTVLVKNKNGTELKMITIEAQSFKTFVI